MTIYEVKKNLAKGQTLVVYDLETTGLKTAGSRILSFSALKVIENNGTFEEIERRNIFINPGFHIPEEITETNHISDETVKNCPSEDEVAEEIIRFLDSADMVTGYNSMTFDDWFINNMSQRVLNKPWAPKAEFDVLSLVKGKLTKGASGDVENHKLNTVAAHFGADKGLTFHNSIDDVIANVKIFWKIKDMYNLPKPISASLWQKYSIQRLYIDNTENFSVYYDMTENKWHLDDSLDKAFLDEVLTPYDGDVKRLINEAEQSKLKRVVFATD